MPIAKTKVLTSLCWKRNCQLYGAKKKKKKNQDNQKNTEGTSQGGNQWRYFKRLELYPVEHYHSCSLNHHVYLRGAYPRCRESLWIRLSFPAEIKSQIRLVEAKGALS